MRFTGSVSYFDQILGKRESLTRQVFNFRGIQFCDFVVLKLFTKMVKNRENCYFETIFMK